MLGKIQTKDANYQHPTASAYFGSCSCLCASENQPTDHYFYCNYYNYYYNNYSYYYTIIIIINNYNNNNNNNYYYYLFHLLLGGRGGQFSDARFFPSHLRLCMIFFLLGGGGNLLVGHGTSGKIIAKSGTPSLQMSKLEQKVLASYQAIRLPRRRSYGNLNDMLFDEHQRLHKNAPLIRKQGWF